MTLTPSASATLAEVGFGSSASISRVRGNSAHPPIADEGRASENSATRRSGAWGLTLGADP
jgi:hypothetical protein